MNKMQIKFMIDSVQAKKDYNKMRYEKGAINEQEYKREYKKLCTEHAKYKRML